MKKCSTLNSVLFIIVAFSSFFLSENIQSQTTIVSDGFENGTTHFTISTTGTTAGFYSGNSGTGDAPASSPLAVEGNYSFGVVNSTANGNVTSVLTSAGNINTVGYSDITLSLRAAAFGVNATNAGIENADYIKIGISTDGGSSYSDYLTVQGNSGSSQNRWAYSATGIATTVFGTTATFAPSGTNLRTTDGYSTLRITSLPAVSNLRIRITLYDASSSTNSERWNIDDFKLTGTVAGPTIITTGTLSAFSCPVSTPSTAQTYTVAGSNLTADISIASPTGFEISTDGTNYYSNLNLTPSGGSVSATPIYVRLNSSSLGTYSGNITHTSTGATQKNIAASGTVSVYYTLTVNASNGTVALSPAGGSYASGTVVTLTATGNTGYVFGSWSGDLTGSTNPTTITVDGDKAVTATFAVAPPWTAYNDCSGTTGGNTTAFTVTSGSTTGLLKNYATGSNTPVTITFTSSGSPSVETQGAYSTTGTDAYTSFYNTANMAGVIRYGSSGYWVDMTLTGLDPAKTYTFATTANRDGSTYASRISQFTLSGDDGAVNSSTSGVTANNDHSVYFCTGLNTANGYVARWTGINPGSDGSFVVRVQEQTAGNSGYGPSVFMLQEEAAAGPVISISGALSTFSTTPGMASATQTYVVTGRRLEENITINAPAGFEVSLDGSTWSSILTLTPVSGTVSSTTVYVRLFSAAEASFSGNITHVSSGATTVNKAVSGTVSTGWAAYNDCAYIDGQISTNITLYEGYTNNETGLLKNFATGSNTAVTVTVTTSGTVASQLESDQYGAETNSGTDAYNTFHGIANMVGGERLGTSSSYIDLTFTGLSASSTYTFATTANRADDTYTDRITKFTLSDADAATNASTAGVTVTDNLNISFCTGYNTVNGYVARWTNINPGSDGDFTVRFAVSSGTYAYGPAVFMLQEGSGETPVQYTLTAGNDSHGTVTLSPTGGVYNEGSTVTLTPVPNTGYAFSAWSGDNAPDPIDNGNGTWSLVMNGNKTTHRQLHRVTHKRGAEPAVLLQPTDGATGVSTSPTLQVTASDANASDVLSVSFYGRAAGTATGADFTFVIIPDPQNYATSYPAVYTGQTQWIVDNKTTSNIVFATSVGDLVNTSSSATEYTRADAAFDILDAGNVPYSVSPGNHDMAMGSLWPTYFGASRFSGKSWYGGSYDDYNTYSLFSASGNDFIVINLQYSPGTAELELGGRTAESKPRTPGDRCTA